MRLVAGMSVIERDWTVHPGETLREALAERSMSQSYFAWATGYSQKHINQIIKGHAGISAEAALRFERELDIPARFWMHMQADYELDVARGITPIGGQS
jgi:HTH-type transcriptional regulator/antitoxin HigA